MEAKKQEKEKQLAWNAYIRDYNRRRNEQTKQALKQVAKVNYNNKILGGI